MSAPDALAELGRVHLIGIGGAGMSAVARILLARGVPVSGSDARESPAVTALRALGATVHLGHEAAHVAGVDTVVVSTAIRATNPELAAARAAGLTVLHRSEALAAAMAGTDVVAVAGTHGKTTTTAMATVLLRETGRDPSFAIGGDVSALGVNAAHGSGGIFVAEADESDGSFLNYHPRVAVVTNIEPDHLDHYGTPEAVHAAFADFAALLGPGDTLIACRDDAGSAALAASVRSRVDAPTVLTYGTTPRTDPAHDALIEDIAPAGTGSRSRLTLPGGDHVDLALRIPGEHNVRNAVAALLAGTVLGVGAGEGSAALGTFTGAGRRFEFKGASPDGTIRVYDDYAHHPTEVAAALAAARAVAGDGAVHVLFQPHLFSRTRIFAAEFAAALAAADRVTVLDIYPAREEPEPGVTSALITERFAPGAAVSLESDPGRAVRDAAAAARPGDLVLTVGAGDVTALGPRLVAALGTATTPASAPATTAPAPDPTTPDPETDHE
ncbi:UDP-N-acetylmuramate--L-alanine ligase [Tersicoccus solisilvae]|uniref:UDP-N-acetylmuramate--L-alanine ligase n=1 Tax=Tersicoccus solisilvae TaxID=1882339 RepID=A0ABQ1PCH0_9MICC|nr:UDP-N-acetylmuramate--L-alanine ligase [Tersicoccus solisilvae]GGC94539.1 UDP-N-acetylmuramate--L-alanine ligase [Tersicoccus solisilvae]